MRKGILFILVFLMMFSIQIESKSNDLKFVIVYDSHEENKIEKKNEIVDLINEALENIEERSKVEMLMSSYHELENEFRKVEMKDTTITFIFGDGLGNKIHGNIVSCSFCMVEVKPKSLIRKWLNF